MLHRQSIPPAAAAEPLAAVGLVVEVAAVGLVVVEMVVAAVKLVGRIRIDARPRLRVVRQC
jgi:hypothetical protein